MRYALPDLSLRELLRTLLAATACLILGCADHPTAQDGGEPLASYLRVALTFTRDLAGTRFDAQGHFVRYRTAEREPVAALLGLPQQIDRTQPIDTCRWVDGAGTIERALQTISRVELLDAGRLVVKGPEEATLLHPWHYPELTPFVTGVVYGVEEGRALALGGGARYEVVSEGGEEITPFVAQATAPQAFPSLIVAPYRVGSDLELSWSAPRQEETEPLQLTLTWSARGAREVRCRVRDRGAFHIPAALVPTGMEPTRGANAEMTAIRVRRAPLAGSGELEIGLREVLPLPLAE